MIPATTHHHGIQKQLLLPGQRILLSKKSISYKRTKVSNYEADFHVVFGNDIDR